jgi:hypothetical protein
MKQMTTFRPYSESDSGVAITVTSANANFPATNLKNIQPTKVWKSTAITEQIVKFDFGTTVSYNSAFINRINFAEFYLEKSADGSTWVLVEHVTGLVKDEVSDEYYVHRLVDITGTYRYLRIRIPSQAPIFNPTYFQVGNFLVGNMVAIWNPKAGYKVTELPKMAITEFRSGYISVAKLGKTRRNFSGNFDKINLTEFAKIIQTYQPFVLYHEFDSDKTSVYLVRTTKEFGRDYAMHNLVNFQFSFEEMV